MKIISLNQAGIQDFSLARNQALSQAKTDWVMFLDSDENITDGLKQEINQAVKDKRFNYQFKRSDWFLGRKLQHGETRRVRLIRLIQPGTGQWQGKVHERFISLLPVKTLTQPLLHQRRLKLEAFIQRLDWYSTLKSQELNCFSLFQLLFYPGLKFCQNYFFRLGFLDGISGLGMAFLMSLHSLFVRVKTYEKTYPA
ncbi:MAG: glycosyltransferase family 2 protein [Candidatus Beckwithbacteria bacterium]